MKKKSKKGKKRYSLIEVVIIMVLTCLVSIVLGSVITFLTIKTSPKSSKEETIIDTQLEDFTNTYNSIIDNYYYKIDKDELLNSAVQGMVDYLNDPYSNLLDKDEAISFAENIKGEYIGIGCEFKKEGKDLVITKILKDSPAENAGIKIGDIVLEIDGNSVSDMAMIQISDAVSGKNNTTITLKVKRLEEELTISAVRKKIDIPSVESSIETSSNQRIGIIKINIFAANTYKQFRKELTTIEKQGIDKLVIDVRDNSGGYLSSASNIASIFLKEKSVIYQLKSKGQKEAVLDTTAEKRTYPIVVLINEETASASEVLALALKESYGAILVGSNSFGKSKIQTTNQLSNGSVLKYTIEEWLSPKGNSVNDKGIYPDIEEYDENEQLNRAIELIN